MIENKILDRFGREILPGCEVLCHCHYGRIVDGVVRKINTSRIIIDIYYGVRFILLGDAKKSIVVITKEMKNDKS